MLKGAGRRMISILIMFALLASEPCEKLEKQQKKILLTAVWRVDLERPRGDLKKPERLHLARE